MTIDLTTQTPAQIDTLNVEKLEPVLNKLARIEMRLNSALHTQDGLLKRFKNEPADKYIPMYGKSKDQAWQDVADLRQERKTILAEVREVNAPFDAEFTRRGGWTRAYIVTNTNGHVHSSTHCKTCFDTTQFHWLTNLSGLDQDDIADQAGERACTICFPNAPVEKRTSIFTPDEKEKAARKVEREAKRAAKAAKDAADAITDVDGLPLLDQYGYAVIKTERTARNELTATILQIMTLNGPTCMQNEGANEVSKAHWANLIVEYKQYAQRLAWAIADKNDTVPSKIYDEHKAKADKKFTAEQRKAGINA